MAITSTRTGRRRSSSADALALDHPDRSHSSIEHRDRKRANRAKVPQLADRSGKVTLAAQRLLRLGRVKCTYSHTSSSGPKVPAWTGNWRYTGNVAWPAARRWTGNACSTEKVPTSWNKQALTRQLVCRSLAAASWEDIYAPEVVEVRKCWRS